RAGRGAGRRGPRRTGRGSSSTSPTRGPSDRSRSSDRSTRGCTAPRRCPLPPPPPTDPPMSRGPATSLAPSWCTGRRGAPALLDRVRVQLPAEYLLRLGGAVLHRAGPLRPGGGVDLVAVGAELLQPLLVLLGQHLPGERGELPHVVGRHPEPLRDAVAVVVVDQEEVPEHPLL